MLTTYDEFIALAEKLGYLPFYGKFLEGFPMLGDYTQDSSWWTGDESTDPWQWKDRAAKEKKLAFGCVLGGHRGFITKALYPYFYAAYCPEKRMEERYADGELSQIQNKLWQLFDGDVILSTADIRKSLGVTRKDGAGAVDTAIKNLQREFFITICGNKRRIARDGREIGWASNSYCRVNAWAPADWLQGAHGLDKQAAREHILDVGVSIGKDVDRAKLSRVLFGKAAT